MKIEAFGRIRRAALFFLAAASICAQDVSVTVEQGYVSRHRTPGSVAHVWAQQNTATRVFARWTGDVQYLADPEAPYTTFIVPAVDVKLQASYRTVPAWSPVTANFNSIPVTYYVPPNPLGLVFMFHGTGGTGNAQLTGSEFGSLARDRWRPGSASLHSTV